ncbi:MAG: hypothetical protein ACOZAN_02885 [Patescibacteria group bacterium]
MSKEKNTKAPAKNLASKFSFFAGVFSLVLLSVLAVSSIILQKRVREQSFDTRKAAQVPPGQSVLVSSVPTSSTSTTFNVGERSSVVLNINTQGYSIDGIQLIMRFQGEGEMFADNNLVVEALAAQGLRVAHLDNNPISCTGCSNARLIRVIAITDDPTRPFTTNNSNVPLLRFNFTPRSAGQISLDFQAQSLAIINGTGTVVDLSNLSFDYTAVVNTPVAHPINWRTNDAYLEADDFYIMANGRRFTGAATYSIASDPPTPPDVNYTTLEVTWSENGTEMRTYLYFRKNAQGWYVDEIRTYNGNNPGDWIYYLNPEAQIPQTAVGRAYTNSGELIFTSSQGGVGEIHFRNLRLQAFLQPEPAQCHYTYGSWSTCTNGWQTRSYSYGPDGCYWYQPETLQELARPCSTGGTLPITTDYFMVYSYESCWHGDSEGYTLLFAWNDDIFSDVTWIDISESPDFSNFAHKNVQDDVQPYYGWLLTNGLGFFRGNNTQDRFYFRPDTRYYVRLYNCRNHSGVLTFYMPRCSGVGGTSYRQCNESCDSNRQCAPNLTCYNGQCRLASNVGSNVCAPRPDQGLNRTCNEYCANSGECQAGYTCWWNRCRNPQNLEDQYCRSTVTTTTYYYYTSNVSGQEVDAECNTVCQSNHQCPANYRCYGGQCRLAANPQSKTCNPSEIVPISGEKGDDSGAISQMDKDPSATNEAELSPTPTTAQASTKETEEETELANETSLDLFKSFLRDRHISPWLLVLAGLGLLLVIIVLIVIANRQDESSPSVYSNPSTYQKSQSNYPTNTSSGSTTKATTGYGTSAYNPTNKQTNSTSPVAKSYGTGIVSTIPTTKQPSSSGYSLTKNTYGSGSYASKLQSGNTPTKPTSATTSSTPVVNVAKTSPITNPSQSGPTSTALHSNTTPFNKTATSLTPSTRPSVSQPTTPVTEKRVQVGYSGVSSNSGMMDKLKSRGITPTVTSQANQSQANKGGQDNKKS